LPIREYRCRNCGNVFENVEIDLKDSKVKCADCGSKKVTRVISLFSSPDSKGSSCDITKRFG
jgi:putative FmdB family regulatory protein